MRGISWLFVLLAMAIFTVGCDQAPAPPPPGAFDAPTDLDVQDPSMDEPEVEEQAEVEEVEEMEPADEPADATEEESEAEDTES
jgi:hypothetical protein